MNLKETLPEFRKRTDIETKGIYYVLLAISIAMTIAGGVLLDEMDMYISLGITIVVALTIIYDRKFIHIPPIFIILVVVCLLLSMLSKLVSNESDILGAISYVLLGVIFSLCGVIVVYVLLGRIPSFTKERPAMVSLMAFTFGVAVYSLSMTVGCFVTPGMTVDDYKVYFNNMILTSIGCFVTSLLFYAGRETVFGTSVFNFLYENSEKLGVDMENAVNDVLATIADGESLHTEFKSTLRTNLKTREKDKRMEKAVLKTIVAFLNSDGGTLLVGVDDSGTIIGIDEDGFDNRDKLNLHMTNLISSQIGDEFLPFIKFNLVPFGEKAVMRVECKKCNTPVFLKDNKTETYFVRSGPSSVELTGSDMIKYIGNMQNIRKLKMPAVLPREFKGEEE